MHVSLCNLCRFQLTNEFGLLLRSALSNLRTLDIYNTSLTGSIPSGVSSCGPVIPLSPDPLLTQEGAVCVLASSSVSTVLYT
jgi:hypothetical protein